MQVADITVRAEAGTIGREMHQFATETSIRFAEALPKCEPRLGKRGLYRTMGGQAHATSNEMAMLWVLNFSDGQHSLLDIAEKSGLPFPALRQAADALREHHLLKVQASCFPACGEIFGKKKLAVS
jgi:aminopeptidase-like protein